MDRKRIVLLLDTREEARVRAAVRHEQAEQGRIAAEIQDWPRIPAQSADIGGV